MKQPKKDAAVETKKRNDGFQNLLTGMGVSGKDKRLDTGYAPTLQLDQNTLRDMYRGDGFAKRIIDLPAHEMTRRGFEISGDPDGKVNAIFEEKNIHRAVRSLLKWSRLYGGSIGVMGLMDGGKLDEPLNEARIKSLEFMHTFGRHQVTWTTGDLYTDAMNPKFGLPMRYSVSPIQGSPFMVHETRVIRMDGLEVTDDVRAQNNGWGDSVIMPCYEQIRSLASVYANSELVVEDFVQAVLSIKNLTEMLAGGQEKVIRDRLDILDLSRHVLNTMLIDADAETYTKHASSISGLPDLMDRFAQALSAVTGMPQTLLMGRSPAGLNATGDSDMRNWYDKIHSEQEDILSPVYERLAYLVFLSMGNEPEGWKINFRPLWEPTDKENADMRKVIADTDSVYLQSGVLDPNEVRNSRFGGNRFGMDIALEMSEAPGMDEPEEEELPPDKMDARKSHVKELLFSQSKFPTAQMASAWAKENGFPVPQPPDERDGFWRIKQRGADDFEEGTLRIAKLKGGVQAVTGKPKSGSRNG